MAKLKEQLINDLLSEYKDAPEQGTPEWLARREGSIGGSEISIITGDNKYKSLTQFIKESAGLAPGYSENIFTRWGTIFEDQIQELIEIIVNCKVHNIGSVKGSIPHHRFSPDGLSTMRLKCTNSKNIEIKVNHDSNLKTNNTDEDILWNKIYDMIKETELYKNHTNDYSDYKDSDISHINIFLDAETMLNHKNIFNQVEHTELKNNMMIYVKKYINILLEFKCPYLRVPDGTIPSEYSPQVKAGLCDLSKQCDMGLFVNSSFRKCSYKDWKFNNTYDTIYHYLDVKGKHKDQVKERFNVPIAIGAIYVYISLEDKNNAPLSPPYGTPEYDAYQHKKQSQSYILNRGSWGEETLIDFGKCDSYCFNNMMTMLRAKELSYYNDKPCININEFKKIDFVTAQEFEIDTSYTQHDKFSRRARVDNFKKSCYDKELIPIGFIPWKLFVCDMIIQYPDLSYLEKHKDKISEIIKIISELKAIEDLSEREDKFYDLTKNLSYSGGRKVRAPKKPIKKKVASKLLSQINDDIY